MNKLGKVCKHGSLARSCYICELESERDRYREALEKIERKATLRGDLHDSIQEIVGRFQNIVMVTKVALEGTEKK